MRKLSVQRPEPVAVPADAGLGRLGPALGWLASVQGAWPPVPPAAPQRVTVKGGGSRAQGQKSADQLADAGCDLLLVGAVGDEVPGLVVLSALLDLEPVQAVGTTTGADWARLTTGVRDGLRATRLHIGDPDALLRVVGSKALSYLSGLLAQSAVRRTPVLLDGSALVAAAALVADRLAPGASEWWLAAQVPPLPAARKGLADLGMSGLLDLGVGGPFGVEATFAVLELALERLTARD